MFAEFKRLLIADLKSRGFWRETATFLVILFWLAVLISSPIAILAVLPMWAGAILGGVIGWGVGCFAKSAERVTSRFSNEE